MNHENGPDLTLHNTDTDRHDICNHMCRVGVLRVSDIGTPSIKSVGAIEIRKAYESFLLNKYSLIDYRYFIFFYSF
jgi:hypothetical protein